MRMAVEKPDRFEGVFNANVFSVLAVHIESKVIIFLRVNCCKVSDFVFQVNFA